MFLEEETSFLYIFEFWVATVGRTSLFFGLSVPVEELGRRHFGEIAFKKLFEFHFEVVSPLFGEEVFECLVLDWVIYVGKCIKR